MPFIAKCFRCGWLARALTRDYLNLVMQGHDIKSHKDDYFKEECWTVMIIKESDYYALQRVWNNSRFWQVIRSPKIQIITNLPLFSGLVAGRISLYAN